MSLSSLISIDLPFSNWFAVAPLIASLLFASSPSCCWHCNCAAAIFVGAGLRDDTDPPDKTLGSFLEASSLIVELAALPVLVDEAVVDELEADIDEPARTSGEPEEAVDKSDGAGEVEPPLLDLRRLVRCLVVLTLSILTTPSPASLSAPDRFMLEANVKSLR